MLFAATAAVAADFPARETADVGNKLPNNNPAWQIGIFNPLRIAVADGIELEMHPLVFLTAPNLDVRVAHLRGSTGELRLTGEYGLSFPTGGLRLQKPFGVKGDLLPSCKVAANNPNLQTWCDLAPWTLVPHVGLVLSGGIGQFAAQNGEIFELATWTIRADVAKGFPLSGQAIRPLETWAPIDVALAPSLGYTRVQVRGQWDERVLDWLRVRGELGGYFVTQPEDADRSPFTFSAYVGADLRTSTHTRVTAGVFYWNSDRHQVVVQTGADGFAEVVRQRSHEFWPTVDFIWMY